MSWRARARGRPGVGALDELQKDPGPILPVLESVGPRGFTGRGKGTRPRARRR